MSYTLYYVNDPMGYFERSETFEALNDEVAIGIVQRKICHQSLELWAYGRLIGRFGPNPDFRDPGEPAEAEVGTPREGAAA